MTTLDPLLRTHEVAERLQVSVSTVKRWVDAGAIQAVRTPGRHRKIATSEADRMARWLADGGDPAGRTSVPHLGERSCDQLADLLGRGDRLRRHGIRESLEPRRLLRRDAGRRPDPPGHGEDRPRLVRGNP